MSTETQNNALESAEPLVARDLLRRAKMVLQLVDKDKGSTICTGGLISDISTYLAAPIAAQPDLTQQTLDDVMAGIPARDAEIEALRKEIETLRAQQDTDRMNALPPLNDDLIAILGRPNFMCAQLADTLRSGGHDIAERAENEQAAVIHFLLGHYLADPAQWAEKASAALKAARKEQA